MENNPIQRTTFFTVLCILSFINGGLNIVFNIPSLFISGAGAMDVYIERLNQALTQADANTPASVIAMMKDAIEMLEKFAMHYQMIIASTMLLSVMSVVGVWLMWSLRKAGFIFYCTAQVLQTLMPFIFFGTNSFVIFVVMLSGFINLLFAILYGTQLKRMG